MEGFLGIDVGSVSTNLVVLDSSDQTIASLYLRTQGQPIRAVQEGLRLIREQLDPGIVIRGVGATGSARTLVGVVVGADIVKNEITAHALAASKVVPGVQTVIEIGGQDSKIIVLRRGIVTDFAMNTVCAAGTGSFLDQQAARLGIPIEEFGAYATKARTPVRIAGRCTVFAESDMIHKQQMGHNLEDIIAGLCQALVRNYLNNVGKGKEISPPVVFQGGVAANVGIKLAFQEALSTDIIVPPYFSVMGAMGVALLARQEMKKKGSPSKFKGFAATRINYKTTSFECKGCSNRCEIINIKADQQLLARWGSRCDKWDDLNYEEEEAGVNTSCHIG